MKYDIFLICPVRNQSKEQSGKIQNYISSLSDKKVYYPVKDTNQNDPIGYRICKDNMEALINSEEIHIWFDKNSQGSLFDLGMAFITNKKLVIANREDIEETPYKSFSNMIKEWEMRRK